MPRRWIPVALVLVAAAADGVGMHGAAFYALLAAVPAAAVAALEAFGDSLEDAGARPHALLWAVVLVLTVTGAAGRAPPLAQGSLPALRRPARGACPPVFCIPALAGPVNEP